MNFGALRVEISCRIVKTSQLLISAEIAKHRW
jgi:hypothetical protein